MKKILNILSVITICLFITQCKEDEPDGMLGGDVYTITSDDNVFANTSFGFYSTTISAEGCKGELRFYPVTEYIYLNSVVVKDEDNKILFEATPQMEFDKQYGCIYSYETKYFLVRYDGNGNLYYQISPNALNNQIYIYMSFANINVSYGPRYVSDIQFIQEKRD